MVSGARAARGEKVQAVVAGSRSSGSFDSISRDEAARDFAQDDIFLLERRIAAELFVGFAGAAAAGHDGGFEAGLEIGGEVVDLGVAVDVDGFGGGVEDDFAVLALGDVLFYFDHEVRRDVAVEEIGEFGEEVSAGHRDLLGRV